jgi:DNA modification methylase
LKNSKQASRHALSAAESDRSREAVLEALRSEKPVSGSTHTFYRYPARFSPEFAREVVRHFSKVGDLVVDPFMGGGTSAVESLAEGRRFIGNDINQLAHFVSSVKTTVLTSREEGALLGWANCLADALDARRSVPAVEDDSRHVRLLPWRLRSVIAQALKSTESLPTIRSREFARCSLLNAAQWALDCKTHMPSQRELLEKHLRITCDMLAGHAEFAKRVETIAGDAKWANANKSLLCGDSSKLHRHRVWRNSQAPALIVTSPPYLGVHVLYHRWQILGRKESSAPYWIAGRSDGHSGVFYTFADRRAKSPGKYLARLQQCFASVAALCTEKTFVAQLVAFTDADLHLPLYLLGMEQAGFEVCETFAADSTPLLREVPNRRWYAITTKQSSSSQEFFLVHRLKNK